MAIKYTLHETPKPNDREGEVLSHARAVCNKTCRLDYICDLVSSRSSISSADVKSVLDSFAWAIALCVNNGDHVELEELGYFSPSLRTRQLGNGKVGVEVDGINYRCATKLKDAVRLADLEKEEVERTEDPAKRKKILIEYLRENGSISLRTYAGISGCSRYRAEADFEDYLKEGVIIKIGHRNRVLYLLP